MNTYKKYCPNVFVAQCEEKQKKGSKIIVTTKYGKENECIIHNFVGYAGTKENPLYCYSITRLDGYNSQERAKNKVDKLNGYADNAEKRSNEYFDKTDLSENKTGIPFGQPILIGHHSEKKHRKVIERANNAMFKAFEENKKAQSYRERTVYWEKLSKKIDLSMPESLEFFKIQLNEAIEYHTGLKNGTIEREHSYSLTYAKKRVNELKKKYETAQKLWA